MFWCRIPPSASFTVDQLGCCINAFKVKKFPPLDDRPMFLFRRWIRDAEPDWRTDSAISVNFREVSKRVTGPRH